MRLRTAAFALALAGIAAMPCVTRADSKIDVLCGGDPDVCKMTSELLEVRLAVIAGSTFRDAALLRASWAWREDHLRCLVGATAITQELLDACAANGLVVVSVLDDFGLRVLTVEVRDVAAFDALVHRADVRGVSSERPAAPPFDPCAGHRGALDVRGFRLRALSRGAPRLVARFAPDDRFTCASSAGEVSLRLAGFDLVAAGRLPDRISRPGTRSERWVWRLDEPGRRGNVVIALSSGDVRIRIAGADLAALPPSGSGSVDVSLTLGAARFHASVGAPVPARR